MIEKIKNGLYSIRKIAVIEVFSNLHEKEEYKCLVLENKKGNIMLLEEKISTSLESILEHLSTCIPILLTINTHKVLEKLEPVNSFQNKDFILSLFPNLSLDAFYFSSTEYASQNHVVLFRKAHLEKYLLVFKKHGFSVIEISLGNSSLNIIKSFLPDCLLSISNKVVEIENHEIKSIFSDSSASTVSSIRLKKTEIKTEFLLPYTHGLCFFSNQNQIVLNEPRVDFMYRVATKKLIKKGLFITLTSLTLTTGFFFYFFRLNQELESKNLAKQHDIQHYTLLKQELEKQMTLFNSTHLKKSSSTPIIDSLGKSIPDEIKLTQLNYHPIIDGTEDEELLFTKKNVILIKGNVFPVQVLTQWINGSLKTIHSIQNVALIRLKETDYNAEFELTLTTNE